MLHMQFEMQNNDSGIFSDNRNLATKENADEISTLPSSQETYANAIAKNVTPTKEQAMVLDSIEGISIDEYIDGLENVVDTG